MEKNTKYEPLADYLRKSGLETLVLSFEEIENILGFPLPPSAKKYPANWSNSPQIRLTWGWLMAGYKSYGVDIKKGIAHFRKDSSSTNTVQKATNKGAKKTMNKTSKTVNEPKDEILLTVPDNLIGLETDEYMMVSLSRLNSDIVEREIENDPGYRNTGKEVCDEMRRKNDYSEQSYFKAIKRIALDNSTRTSADAMQLLAIYCADPFNGFLGKLKEGNPELVDEMLAYLVNEGERKDKSLISKICRYLNEWWYENDAYTINDSVVRKVLPYYLAYYKIDKNLWRNKKLDDMNYAEFFAVFDALKTQLPELNRHELDHLIWYSYKNDPIRSSIAVAMAEILSN